MGKKATFLPVNSMYNIMVTCMICLSGLCTLLVPHPNIIIIYNCLCFEDNQVLEIDDLRILSIVLAGYATQLSSLGLNLDQELENSDRPPITKKVIVSRLQDIGENGLASILKGKQGKSF